MDAASLPFLSNTKKMDLSLLGHDCVHFSPRGLSLLHIAIWNAMLTKLSDRSKSFNFSLERPRCADPQCPFIRTTKNSAFCIWNQQKTGNDNRHSEQLLAISVLFISVVLFIIILATICRRRKSQHRKVNGVLEIFPKKTPVGAHWTSLKYIDEESIKSFKS